MNGMTLDEVCRLVEGSIEGGDPAAFILGAAPVNEAGQDEVTFFSNSLYLPALRKTKAAAVLVPSDFAEEITTPRIRVENPSLAFTKLVAAFSPEPITFSPGIHPTAVVSPTAKLAADVSIQPYAVIEAGVQISAGSVIGAHSYIGHETKIGEYCILYPHVTIRERCVIADRIIIHSGVVIGSDGFGFELVNGKYIKIPQTGIVQIDNDVEIGANTTIDRARFGRTWIQEGVRIDNQVMIAHNVVVGAHTILCAQVGISGSTHLGKYVTIAGQAGIVGHVEIGDQAIIGAKSGIGKSIPAKSIYLGTPGEPIADSKHRFALTSRSRMEKLFRRLKALEKSVVIDSKDDTHLSP